MAYIFDTNIFIRSKHEMPMDLWPTFWRRIAEMINAGDVLSNIQVKGEIDKGGDELTDWMKHNVPAGFYIGNDADVMVRYGEVINFLLYCLIAGMSAHPTNPVEGCADANPKTMLPNDT